MAAAVLRLSAVSDSLDGYRDWIVTAHLQRTTMHAPVCVWPTINTVEVGFAHKRSLNDGRDVFSGVCGLTNYRDERMSSIGAIAVSTEFGEHWLALLPAMKPNREEIRKRAKDPGACL